MGYGFLPMLPQTCDIQKAIMMIKEEFLGKKKLE